MQLSLIAALSENHVIGRGLELPWHLPKDLKHFKKTTVNHTIVMGRLTWDSVGRRPLPKRRTIVMSRDPDFRAEGAEAVRDLDAALELAKDDGEVFIVGGSAIYALALPYADRLYLTRIHAEIEGDVFFPTFDESAWPVVERERHLVDDRHAHAFTIELRARVGTCGQIGIEACGELLTRYALKLAAAKPGEDIPGSHWGAPEAGLLGKTVHVRGDTPIHSFLHEACHTICMDAARRASLDTDAGGEEIEESGVCYLQIVLAEHLPGMSSARLMEDMDRWGYSFRLGSTRAWFEQDADDARAWLTENGLLDVSGTPTWKLRG